MNKKGITIIELLIVLALISLVMSLIFPQFFFGMFTFARGESHSQIQFELRMAGNEITKLVRNATEIEITSTRTNDGYEYLWIENETLKYQNESGNIVFLTDSILDETNSDFSIPFESRYFLRFTLMGVKEVANSTQHLTIESMVLLNNILKEPNIESGGTIIKFQNPN